MFGGWGVTVNGNMALGVMERDLIVRVGPETFDEALTRPGVRPFDFTGRSMTGWVFVAGDAVCATYNSAPLIHQATADPARHFQG